MTDYAVISSNEYSHYSFYAPLTSAVWRARGYVPLLLLVGDENKWLTDPRLRIIRDKSIEAGAKPCFLGGYSQYRGATVAQVSRLFACVFSATPLADDYLLTSDIDMWPLGPWVGGGRDASRAFHLYYANAYADTGRVHFPICYIGAQVRYWTEVMVRNSSFAQALALCAARPVTPENAGLVHQVDGDDIPLDVWTFDETYFGECLQSWSGFPDRCQMIQRDMRRPGERRLDRSAWVDLTALDGYADAHLLRPGYSAANWPRVRRLFQMLVPGRAAWAEDYHAALARAGG